MSMFEDIPVDVGVIYEGERIRRNNMQIELGGPKQAAKFELVRAKKMDEIEDKKVIIIGPDLKDLPEGGNVPFGIYIEVAGKAIEEDKDLCESSLCVQLRASRAIYCRFRTFMRARIFWAFRLLLDHFN